jgi:hypothetical protein
MAQIKMKILLLILFSSMQWFAYSQELYVFSEPASNMPAHSLSVKQDLKWLRNSGRTESRQNTEFMLGLNKNWMLHAVTGFSNMYSTGTRWESARIYAKYRFLSQDELYHHFRMAAFAAAAYSRNAERYDELSLEGDQSGMQAGIIATQLLHKLALSGTISYLESLQPGRSNKNTITPYSYQSLQYSLSAGYLIFPKKYTSYGQTNLNLYLELLGQKNTDRNLYAMDLAPAVQLIFNSAVKLNAGYRFQLTGNMNRMSDRSWLLGFEWLFLNVLK